MKIFSAPDHRQRSVSMSSVTPIVFVVDDDISVRESLEALIRFAGWQPETFASAQEFCHTHRSRFRIAWCWTSVFRGSMVSICRSASLPIGSICQSSSLPGMATYP